MGEADPAAGVDEPVIILTGARCGSTLLRMLLDAHPDLACPPETNVVKACAQLGAIFSLVSEGSPASGDLVAAKVQAVFSAVFADYLARRGKRRWCDKSLGTAPVAEWFAGLYPKAKFICLYRHCMDVVYSGLQASPWGLLGYGFEQYAGRLGGNNVSALAAYWAEHTSRIMQFQRENQDRCFQLHYERLVSEPERTTAEIFAFLGAEEVPGITRWCLAASQGGTPLPHSLGPGDHKIRATSKITAGSVGQGIRVPVDLIPAPQLKAINLLLGELGYTLVDDAWRASPCPPDLLTTGGAAGAGGPAGDNGAAGAGGPAGAGEDGTLGDELMRTVLANIGEYISSRVTASFRLGQPSTVDGWQRFGLVAYHADGLRLARGWQVDIAEQSVNEVAEVDAEWLVTGDIETWLGVLAGRANMASCLRNGTLRYIGRRDAAAQGMNGALAAAAETERRLTKARELLGLAE